MRQREIIIAIDGHSSTGKSSFAKAIARSYGLKYVDTGALYRGVTLVALRDGIHNVTALQERVRLQKLLSAATFSFLSTGEEGEAELYLDEENIEVEIRSMEVAQMVSKMAPIPFIREYVNNLLREYGRSGGVVMDGRDIGTVVFPNAHLKIFMTATPNIRAQRRYNQMVAKGEKAEYNQILNNVIERDRLDETREIAPLRRAEDAILLDNSNMTQKEQMQWIEKIMAEKWGLNPL